jgi:hypothetical protein
MTALQPWVVSIYENELSAALALYDAVSRMFAKLADKPAFEVRWSVSADSLPTAERIEKAVESRSLHNSRAASSGKSGTPGIRPPSIEEFAFPGSTGSIDKKAPSDAPVTPHLDDGFAWDAFEDQILIVDLKMPPASRYTAYGQYGGMDVLEAATRRGCLYRVFVCSQEIENIGDSYPDIHERLELMKANGLTLFTKTGGFDDLCNRIYSFVDLDRARYWLDPETRNRLYEVAQSGGAASQDSVLILGKTGTGKEYAAEHIARIGNWLRNGQERDLGMETIHCGALSIELARDQLFGHVKGSFTDAGTHELGHVLRALGCKFRRSNPLTTPLKQEVANFKKALLELEETHRVGVQTGQLPIVLDNARRAGLALGDFILEADKKICVVANRLADAKEDYGNSKQFRDWLLDGTEFLKKATDDEDCFDLDLKDNAPYGTVFLDEFADLIAPVQALILRLVQNGEVRPHGYPGSIRLMRRKDHHIRFIGATNKKEIAEAVIVRIDDADAGCKDTESPVLPAIGVQNERALAEADADEADVAVRADLVYRIAGLVIELPELNEDEVAMLDPRHSGNFQNENDRPLLPGILIRYEEEACGIRGEWEQAGLRLLRRGAKGRRFRGHRRQLRTIIRRALRLASNRPHTGMDPLATIAVQPGTGTRWPISEAIVRSAINPIVPKSPTFAPPPSSGSGDPAPMSPDSHFLEVRQMFRERRFRCIGDGSNVAPSTSPIMWDDCPHHSQLKVRKARPSLWVTAQERFTVGGECRWEVVIGLMLASIWTLPDYLSNKKAIADFWNVEEATVGKYLNRKTPEFDQRVKTAYLWVTGTALPENATVLDQIREAGRKVRLDSQAK